MTSRARARTAPRAVARAVTTSALVAVALTGCGSDEPREPSRAAGPADRAQVSTSAVPTTPTTPTTPTRPVPSATAPPRSAGASPSAPPASTPAAGATPAPGGAPDGTVVGVVRSADATSVTYDKVDERPASCAAIAPKQPVPFEEGFAACFSNVNPLLRTVPLAPGAVVRVLQEGDGPRAIPAAGLGAFLTSSDNTHPPAYTVFRIRVSGGRATALEQVGVSFT